MDGSSSVLPYVHALALGLVRRGYRVCVFASRTRYNGEFLDDLKFQEGVEVVDAGVSRTVAAPWFGLLAYAGLWWRLWRRRSEFGAINLQFSVLWPLELPFAWALRQHFVFTLHNPVPHGHSTKRHIPTAWFALLARSLIFVSHATREGFVLRYGAGYEAKSLVLPHGLLGLEPADVPVAYSRKGPPEALVFWGTVKPYKGVDIMAELARSAQWQNHGLPLEVHGKWDAELAGLKIELQGLGVTVVDAYLDAAALKNLMRRNVVFILPYVSASQSGALFTLLHQGCRFICTDVGDLGDFMRRFNLTQLLLAQRDAPSVLQCLARLNTRLDAPPEANPAAQTDAVTAAFQRAQLQSDWDITLASADAAYANLNTSSP